MKRGNVEKMANVEEKTVYDNFIGKKEQDNRPATLAEFLGEDEDAIFEEPWQEHWHGMPEFEQEDNKPYKCHHLLSEESHWTQQAVQRTQSNPEMMELCPVCLARKECEILLKRTYSKVL